MRFPLAQREHIIAEVARHASSPFTEGLARLVLRELGDKVVKSISTRLGIPSKRLATTHFLSASTPAKLSFHIVTPVVMDSHATSGAHFAYEIASAIRTYIIQRCRYDFATAGAVREESVILLQLAGRGKGSYALDLVPYARSQLYRMAGNTKVGQRRPFRPIDMHFSHTINDATYSVIEVAPSASVLSVPGEEPFSFHRVYTAPTWVTTHVQNVLAPDVIFADTVRPFTVGEPPSYPWQKEAERNVSSDLTHWGPPPPLDAFTASRGSRAPSKISHIQARTFIHGRSGPALRETANMDDTAAVVIDDGCTTCEFARIPPDTIVFCPRCETVPGAFGLLSGIGTPSAKTTTSTAGSPMIFCFACCTAIFATSTFKRIPMSSEPDEICTLYDETHRINSHGRCDLELREGVRVLALSAPTGIGKSTWIRSLISSDPSSSVCAISYREVLARNQAEAWSLTDYKSDGAYDASAVRRISICVNSVRSLPFAVQYDMVILDEADAIRASLGSTTMNDRYVEVVWRLRHLMRKAGLVVCAQADLSEEAVYWVSQFAGVDPDDREKVQRCTVKSSRKLYPLAVSDTVEPVIAKLAAFYISRWSPSRGECSEPIICFCTQKAFAAALHTMIIQRIAMTPQQRERVKLVTRDTHQRDEWVRHFTRNPNTATDTVDVVIASPVLAAGISIDTHFKACFWFLHNAILTHEEEYQMVRRLRHELRYNCMHPWAYAYIQPGCSDSYTADIQSVQSAMRDVVMIAAVTADGASPLSNLRTMIQGEIQAERADTFNRHGHLWRLRYGEGNHPLRQLSELKLPAPHLVTAISPEESMAYTQDVTRIMRSKSRAIKNWYRKDPLAAVEESIQEELWVDIAEQVKFEASRAKADAAKAVERSGRFKNVEGAARRLALCANAGGVRPQAAYALGKWLEYILHATGRNQTLWASRCQNITSSRRFANANAAVEILAIFAARVWPMAQATDLRIPAPGTQWSLTDCDTTIRQFRISCMERGTAEHALWTAAGYRKLVGAHLASPFKLAKTVIENGCGLKLSYARVRDHRRSEKSSPAVVITRESLNALTLILLSTRRATLSSSWRVINSAELESAIDTAEATIAAWPESEVINNETSAEPRDNSDAE